MLGIKELFIDCSEIAPKKGKKNDLKILFTDLGLRKNRNYKNIVTFSIFKQQQKFLNFDMLK